MFRTLRTRLILAFTIVIALTLFLAGSTFVYILREYQSQLRANQLAEIALPLSYQVAILDGAGATLEQIAGFLEMQATDLEVRILLMDSQRRVVVDTGKKLEGKQIDLTEQQMRTGLASYWGHYTAGDQPSLFVVTSVPRAPRPILQRTGRQATGYQVALTVPQQSLSTAWMELTPGLSLAALLALIVSFGAAILLSRSITGPIRTLTSASLEIARGNYDYHVPRQKIAEIDTLAQSFNRMAKDIAHSQRLMRDFLANVSHELRTPITSIQGFAQAMVDGTLRSPGDYQTAGQVVREESSRMHRLVDDLLYLSKIESGQVALNIEPVDLSELVADCLRSFDLRAAEKGVALKSEVEPALAVPADPHRLEQVLVNLIDNAVKHTPAGGLVQVAARNGIGDSTKSVEISVSNTGSYIAPEHLSRVFERFYQVDASRSRNGNEGSGLGLCIVQELVQLHGGSIAAESDEQNGTIFTVKLPALRAA